MIPIDATDTEGLPLFWRHEDHPVTNENKLRPALRSHDHVADVAQRTRVLPAEGRLSVPAERVPSWLFVD